MAGSDTAVIITRCHPLHNIGYSFAMRLDSLLSGRYRILRLETTFSEVTGPCEALPTADRFWGKPRDV